MDIGDVHVSIDTKAVTIDYFSSRLFRRLVDKILHNSNSGLSLALKDSH